MRMADSARWCMFCKKWGDHHTDRCPVTPDRDKRLAAATAKTEAEWQRIQREVAAHAAREGKGK